MNRYIRTGWGLLLLLLIGFYLFWVRQWVAAAWYGQAPGWFEKFISVVYPRFIVEKHRFDLPFFLRKADQVVIRFTVVSLIILVLWWLQSQRASLRNYLNRTANPVVPLVRISWIAALFFAGMLFFTWEWYGYLKQLYLARAFYKPLLLLRVLQLDFPNPTVSAGLCGLLWLSCLATLFRVKPVFSSTVAAILFVLLQAWLYSFEKMDHTFAPVTYAAMLMPFLLHERNKVLHHATVAAHQPGWPLFLIQLAIGLIYLQSGLEKLLISGINWLSPLTFRNYIYLHQAPLGLRVAQSELLCLVLPLLSLWFQLGFIGIVFFPRLRWVFLPAGFLFHTGTYLLLGVGWYFNAWVFTYLFFIPWEKVLTFVKQRTDKPVKGAVAEK